VAYISQQSLQRIFTAHQLGLVKDIVVPRRGSTNLVVVINDEYVVRLDFRHLPGESRYKGEKLAYEALAHINLPVPRVVVMDLSKRLIQQNYIILTRSPGQPMIDAWAEMSPPQRIAAAFSAGQHLARMHTLAFNHYGPLKEIGMLQFHSFYDYLYHLYERFSQQAMAIHALPTEADQRIRQLFDENRDLLMAPHHMHMVHGDYQLENLLVEDGIITGVIDFEWAFGGDPTWDFVAEDKWDEQCPGSRDAIYAGYRQMRPLDPDHERKLRLYKAVMYVETIAGATDWRAWAQGRLADVLQGVP
jgi:aminoglycoside phosphotransferase (APT) family kinase protein